MSVYNIHVAFSPTFLAPIFMLPVYHQCLLQTNVCIPVWALLCNGTLQTFVQTCNDLRTNYMTIRVHAPCSQLWLQANRHPHPRFLQKHNEYSQIALFKLGVYVCHIYILNIMLSVNLDGRKKGPRGIAQHVVSILIIEPWPSEMNIDISG